MSNFP